jgi:Acetyltransferases, including N-acetylases of ribosomal proteins
MLETARLTLRPWQAADAALLHELWAERDPRVPAHRRLDADGRPTVAEFEERVRSGALDGFLVVVERHSGEPVGYCGIATTEGEEPELAFELLRRVWARGYATEAAAAVVDDARRRGIPALVAGVREWNAASLRVLDKLGFAPTGRVDPDPEHGDSVLRRLVL